MTAYGELVTQKENFSPVYLLIPAQQQENSVIAVAQDNISDATQQVWEQLNEAEFALVFQDFFVKRTTHQNLLNTEKTFRAVNRIAIMQFCLEGNCECQLDFLKQKVKILDGEHNIFCLPTDEVFHFSNSANFNSITIYLDHLFLLKYIPVNHFLIEKMESAQSNSLYDRNLAIKPKMQSVLNDIINCEFDGHLRKLYLQAKIIELFSLQLSQYEKSEDDDKVHLKESDREKMLLVKNLISNNFEESYSLSHLARLVGTNEQYLKKHFKIMFGQTVFGYILSCKMEKAKQMLLTGEYKIVEIAAFVGYKHATHFTTAFKKFFGYPPQKIKGE
ncbi:helix-turn-helix domain-containing protein [Pedobacter cryophilus]|uniref:Helix-turn-helix transcriptional regulator n=1 Tax=Pedobacter cryophilus TaxID=2571271 RepID=A0A4U1C265_9SPHI|nr:AraC family transcriptional regulator [Pedobacter cryophilus]TKB99114.1 helix-turn-helix transcriptional regulator [Pedobacter cryophilus]